MAADRAAAEVSGSTGPGALSCYDVDSDIACVPVDR